MEVCSENRGLTALASPRISFSHDLSQSDLSPSSTTTTETSRLDSSLPLDPTAEDFDFSLSVGISTDDPSLADELFSDGKLLPLPIKNPSTRLPPSPGPPPHPPPTIPLPKKHGSLREIMASSEDDDDNVKRSPSSSQKSFWRFRRSSSLNCGGGSRRGLVCPFTLLRSKSTGSSPTINPPSVRSRPDKHHNKTNQNNSTRGSCKDDSSINSSSSLLFRKVSTDSSARTYYYSGTRRSCSNGVRISPILNVPAATCVFGYLSCSCGVKSMRRGSTVTCSP
ncbi:uncharacterized protein LOC103712923 [Phoenix dactylifera]|uniref:Uncharacterized protein LOC103712923 n=1 Tax=Phoenix dactylifera TaxID=42345 RepID=A0A8B7MV69_PHODC|nr:uncharacterized protein LOC103712923 [Phoenix dactylifera]